MKTSSQAGLLLLLGAGCGLCAVFHKPLGLPAWSDVVFTVGALILVCLGLKLERRAKERGDPSTIPSTMQQHQRRVRSSLILVVLVSVAGPLWLPYTGLALSLPQLIVVATIGGLLSVVALMIGARRIPPRG